MKHPEPFIPMSPERRTGTWGHYAWVFAALMTIELLLYWLIAARVLSPAMRVIVVLLAPMATIFGMAIVAGWRAMRAEFLDSQRRLLEFDPEKQLTDDIMTILRMGSAERSPPASAPRGMDQAQRGAQLAALGDWPIFERTLDDFREPIRSTGVDLSRIAKPTRLLRLSWWIIATGFAVLAIWVMMALLSFLGFTDKEIPTLIVVALPFAILTMAVMDPHRNRAVPSKVKPWQAARKKSRGGVRRPLSHPARRGRF